MTFETGTKGVPIKSLIPEKDRGDAFGEFRVADYFGLAQLVLASVKDLAAAKAEPAFKAATAEKPVKLSLPIDLDYLGLRGTDGSMDAERTIQLFEVVQAYWLAKPNILALEPGLVAGLWRRGMSGADIIRFIQASTGKDGKLIKGSGRGHDIMTTVINVYLSTKGLPKNTEISREAMKDLVDRWLTATRSAPLGSSDMQNSVLHWSEYRHIGLIDEAGAAQLAQVQRIAAKVFQSDQPLNFQQVAAWVTTHSPKNSRAAQPPKAARALLKKKRKQGKVNRKRGRK